MVPEKIRAYYRGMGKRFVGCGLLGKGIFVYTLVDQSSERETYYGYFASKDNKDGYHFDCGYSCKEDAEKGLRYIRRQEKLYKI
jgi:hypothetical protein